MVNEIATLLANHESGKGESWFIDGSFRPFNVPKNCKWLYSMVVGTDPDTTVPSIISLLNSVDIESYKSVFDNRTLFYEDIPDSAYGLHYAHTAKNTLNDLANYPGSVSEIFSGDKYLQSLRELYSGTPEGTIKLCAVILALAYRMKMAYELKKH